MDATTSATTAAVSPVIEGLQDYKAQLQGLLTQLEAPSNPDPAQEMARIDAIWQGSWNIGSAAGSISSLAQLDPSQQIRTDASAIRTEMRTIEGQITDLRNSRRTQVLHQVCTEVGNAGEEIWRISNLVDGIETGRNGVTGFLLDVQERLRSATEKKTQAEQLHTAIQRRITQFESMDGRIADRIKTAARRGIEAMSSVNRSVARLVSESQANNRTSTTTTSSPATTTTTASSNAAEIPEAEQQRLIAEVRAAADALSDLKANMPNTSSDSHVSVENRLQSAIRKQAVAAPHYAKIQQNIRQFPAMADGIHAAMIVRGRVCMDGINRVVEVLTRKAAERNPSTSGPTTPPLPTHFGPSVVLHAAPTTPTPAAATATASSNAREISEAEQQRVLTEVTAASVAIWRIRANMPSTDPDSHITLRARLESARARMTEADPHFNTIERRISEFPAMEARIREAAGRGLEVMPEITQIVSELESEAAASTPPSSASTTTPPPAATTTTAVTHPALNSPPADEPTPAPRSLPRQDTRPTHNSARSRSTTSAPIITPTSAQTAPVQTLTRAAAQTSAPQPEQSTCSRVWELYTGNDLGGCKKVALWLATIGTGGLLFLLIWAFASCTGCLNGRVTAMQTRN